MKLSQFKYNLPKELIAEKPAIDRDASRLMVIHKKTKQIEHRLFSDILEYFDEKDLFVSVDTYNQQGLY
jgi:S-adenosylmethionine:tRNA ribosyltransferase-isomerase